MKPKNPVDWMLDRRLVRNFRWLLFDDKTDLIPPKPDTRHGFSPPVAWLLGRQALAAVKWMVLYAAFRDRLDLREWMTPTVQSFSAEPGAQEFWFDYLADTGDGQLSMYSLAYLCLSDLWLEREPPSGDTSAPSATTQPPGKSTFKLPRGAFLFVGGDTGYPISDLATLTTHFQLPFRWAAIDLASEGKPLDDRALFGIPGNHDYYDALDGFHRQFRRPVCPETGPADCVAQLSIPGFKRRQQASYVALRLPFGWWLWGLDAAEWGAGLRQLRFFAGLNGGSPPAKLIVATPQPTTVLGTFAEKNTHVDEMFEALKLEKPFHDGAPLDPGKSRLDIAGDTHRYARYWGPGGPDAQSGAPAQANYASVVAGIGGAVLHPWSTDVREVQEQALYPSMAVSRPEFARQLLSPANMFTAGFLWLMGASAAMILYVGGTLIDTSKALVDTMLLRRLLRISTEQIVSVTRDWRITSVVAPLDVAADLTPFLYSLAILASLLSLVAAVVFAVRRADRLDAEAATRPITGWDYWPVWLAYGLAIVIIGGSTWAFGRYPARRVFTDVVSASVFLLLTAGNVLFAIFVGARYLPRARKIFFAILGLWHGLLQVLVPFLLIRIGSPLRALLMLAIGVALVPVGNALVRRAAPRWMLAAVWLLYGALMLAIPLAWSARVATLPQGWIAAAFIALAGAVGATWICVWFGWYLLVALTFAGHNDEAAGAARIEKFKGFLRIRITETDLTAFVVAVDDPQIHGRLLRPKVVDVFTLKAS